MNGGDDKVGNGDDDIAEVIRISSADAITEVPDEVLKELGDILHTTPDGELDESPSGELLVDRTPEESQAKILSFPVAMPGGEDGDVASVVVIDDEEHSVTVIADDDSIDRIVIVDDDSLDTQFEQRRERARHQNRFKKIRVLVSGAVVVVVLLIVVAFLASPMFGVRQVTIEGNVYTSTETLTKASEMLRGKSIFTLDTDVVARLIEDDPWVADARISKQFFRSVVVEIQERIPVVWYVGSDNKARVLDTDGVVIAVLDGWPTKYFQVAGIGPDVQAGQRTDDVYRAAAQLVTALPEEIRSKTHGLELSPGGALSMVLKTGTVVRFGEPTNLQNKLVAVVVLLRRQDPVLIKAIDVSTGDATVELK